MTMLDTVTRRTSKRQARRDAERGARRLHRRVRLGMLTGLGLTGVLFAAGLLGTVLAQPVLMLAWPLAVLAGAVAWAGAQAQRRSPTQPEGIPLHVLIERSLHQHLAQVADRLHTRPPTEVWMIPEPVVRFEPDPDAPVLYLGAPLLWHLDVDELDRMVAGELALMNAVLDPDIRPVLQLAARLDVDRLTHDTTPLVGPLVRHWGRSVEAARATFLDAVRSWADCTVPESLCTTPDDAAELDALTEVGELVGQQRATAAGQGIGVAAIGAHTAGTVRACEAAGVLAPRPARTNARPAVNLLNAPPNSDQRLATQLAGSTVAGQAPIVGWDRLPQLAWMPHWRSQRDAVLPVLAQLTGTWPTTLRELVGGLRPDDGADDGADVLEEAGAALARYPVRPIDAAEDSDASDGPDGSDGPQTSDAPVAKHLADRVGDVGTVRRRAALTTALSAAVRVSAVEQESLHLAWDDAWGGQVVDDHDGMVPVEAFVADAVARGEMSDLVDWMSGLGLDVDCPWTGAGTPEGDVAPPINAFAATTRGRGLDLVLTGGWLLGYPHPRRSVLRAWRQRLRPQRQATQSLRDLATAHRAAELVAVADPHTSARLVDVISARMSGPAHGLGWQLDLELPERRLRLAGSGTGRELADALAIDLGDRLIRTGTARPGAPEHSVAARAWWLGGRAAAAACLAVAALVLTGGAVVSDHLTWLSGSGPVGEATTVVAIGALLAVLAAVGFADSSRRLERVATGQPLAASPPLRAALPRQRVPHD